MAKKTTSSQEKRLNQKSMPDAPAPRSQETTLQATAGTGAASGRESISGSPVSGWNSQKGSDLARDVDLVAGNDVEFSSEVGAGSDVGGEAGLEARAVNNLGMGQKESSQVAADTIPAGASVLRQRTGGVGPGDDDSDLKEQILSKIHDLGDALDRVTDRIAGDGAIGDALQRLKGRYVRPHGDQGRDTTNRDHLI